MVFFAQSIHIKNQGTVMQIKDLVIENEEKIADSFKVVFEKRICIPKSFPRGYDILTGKHEEIRNAIGKTIFNEETPMFLEHRTENDFPLPSGEIDIVIARVKDNLNFCSSYDLVEETGGQVAGLKGLLLSLYLAGDEIKSLVKKSKKQLYILSPNDHDNRPFEVIGRRAYHYYPKLMIDKAGGCHFTGTIDYDGFMTDSYLTLYFRPIVIR